MAYPGEVDSYGLNGFPWDQLGMIWRCISNNKMRNPLKAVVKLMKTKSRNNMKQTFFGYFWYSDSGYDFYID